MRYIEDMYFIHTFNQDSKTRKMMFCSLPILEQISIIKVLLETAELTQAQAAEVIGLDDKSLRNRLIIEKLCPEVQIAVQDGRITWRQAWLHFFFLTEKRILTPISYKEQLNMLAILSGMSREVYKDWMDRRKKHRKVKKKKDRGNVAKPKQPSTVLP